MYHKAREALMEDACRKGLVNAIGVSNMKIHHLEKLKETANLWPAVNRVEVHPLYPQQELLEYCPTRTVGVLSKGRHCCSSLFKFGREEYWESSLE